MTADAAPAFVDVDRISLTYPGAAAPAVSALSFAAARGEVVTLLGPSGCGKTTALRMIAGLERPDAGTLRVAGRDVTDWPPERRRMGFVFQNYALFPHLTVAENVAFGLRARKAPKAEIAASVPEALALVDLAGYDGRRIDQMSGGQQQRVALARALAIKPEVLLLDEPLSNLDASLREQTREALRHVVRKLGVTTFFVTHDQSEAFALSDRIVLMRAGRLVEVGAPERLYREPETRFAAEFLGAANIIPAAATGDTRTAHVGARRLEVGSWSDGAPRDGEVLLVARPETVELAEAEAPNALPGRVVDTVFLGASYRTTVALDGSDLVVRATQPAPAPAERVWVRLAPDSLRALRSQE
jgi:ABC-type Fe3+/spermidine/putrescine transport system ATPase subunit